MSAFRWLHLTDLHLGMPGQVHLWPNFEAVLLADLRQLVDRVGPWQMVLFTGDLTQQGSKAEFDAVEALLLKLWTQFGEWGFEPKLLAIPGNHDLMRPEVGCDPALITLLHTWELPVVQEPFWSQDDSAGRQLVKRAFAPFFDWWHNTALPKPADLTHGLLPGDSSASFKPEGEAFSVGVVGLNSAFLQLADGDFQGKLALDIRQLNAVCNGHPPEWTGKFDVCLLATHHPVSWLSQNATEHFANEIHAPADRFALHLFGHMHESNLTSMAQGGGEARRALQGTSLFGLEHWGQQNAVRQHGYSLCELRLEDEELQLRVWPRTAKVKPGGGRFLERDQDSFVLDETTGATKAAIVKQLKKCKTTAGRSGPTESPSPVAEVAGAQPYDPRNRPFHVPYQKKGDQVVGRDQALLAVRQQLTSGRRTAIGQTAVFQGLGGLGKTQLAVEYAYRYEAEYPNGVVWLTADLDIDAQLVDLAIRSRWVSPELEHQYKLQIAQKRLRSTSNCLIVFDNLENLEAITDYLPVSPTECHVLVTSRTEQVDFSYVPIDVLSHEHSLALLFQSAGGQPGTEAEWGAASLIATKLGGLPLALELAGSYLARRPVSWQEYAELLKHNLKLAMPSRLASLTAHQADLYSTLQISDSVFEEEPRLRDVVDLLTWSAPSPMDGRCPDAC